MTRTASSLLLGLIATLAACTTGDESGPKPNGDTPQNPNNPNDPTNPGDPPNPPGGMAVSEFLTALGKKDCDDAFACKANFPTDQGVTFAEAFGASTNECYMDAATYYNASSISASITAGKIIYTAADAKSCVESLKAPTCSTYWTAGPDFSDKCDTALVGKVATGAACTNDFECSGENWCDDTSKKCAAIPQGARKGSRSGIEYGGSVYEP